MVGSDSILTAPVCFRNVASAFDHPSNYINSLSKLLDSKWTIDECLGNCKEFASHCKSHPQELFVMRKLFGIVRHSSTHAGGVIIAKDICSYMPIRTAGDRSVMIAGLDKDAIHDLGFTKFDILGLTTLKTIAQAQASINEEYSMSLNLDDVDYEDPEVYKMLCEGDVYGVFQLSNQADMVKQQQPKSFNDLIAINALIRPGVGDFNEYCSRKNGKSYSIDDIRLDYMSDTYGLMTYQEQFLLDCNKYAGWGIAFADAKVRKNKNIKADTALKELFLSDGAKNGHDIKLLEQIWSEIESAVDGGYSFNKSHAASYAITSFKTAWLKCYYPEHFYAALLTHQCADTNEISEVMFEVKKKNIPIKPPHINISKDSFTAKGGSIFYMLSAIKDVGDKAYEKISYSKPYTSVDDLMLKTEKKYVRSNVVESLIKAGCFDFEDSNRVKLLNSVFGSGYCNLEWNDETKMKFEYESIGFYLTSHPLDKYFFNPLSSFSDNETALIAGEIVSVTEKTDKKNNKMGFLTISTQFGMVRGLIFSSKWSNKVKEALIIGDYFVFTGTKSNDAILINKISRL